MKPIFQFFCLRVCLSLSLYITLLVSLYNKLVSAVSHQQVSCLCLLDISAAFDTIDHNILLQRLSSWFGVSSTALLWFQSYLSTRSFSVKACSHSSQPLPFSYGVPQGSVPGPSIHLSDNSSSTSFTSDALSVILVLLSILISLSPTTSPTSPAPASCSSVTSAAFDPCLILKLPPPLPPPLSILN